MDPDTALREIREAAKHIDRAPDSGYEAPRLALLTDSWAAYGKCRDYDPELFFPEGLHPEDRPETKAALAICQRCPVLAQCLGYALSHPRAAWYGIWGGKLPDQRLKLNRQRRGLH